VLSEAEEVFLGLNWLGNYLTTKILLTYCSPFLDYYIDKTSTPKFDQFEFKSLQVVVPVPLKSQPFP